MTMTKYVPQLTLQSSPRAIERSKRLLGLLYRRYIYPQIDYQIVSGTSQSKYQLVALNKEEKERWCNKGALC